MCDLPEALGNDYMCACVSCTSACVPRAATKKQQPDHLPGSLPSSQISNTPYLRLVGSQSRHHSLRPLTSADDHSSDENYRLQEAADMWLPTKAYTHRDDGWAPFYSESTESTDHFSGNLQHCLHSHWKDDSVSVLMRLWELIIHTTLWLTISHFTSCAFIAFASWYTSVFQPSFHPRVPALLQTSQSFHIRWNWSILKNFEMYKWIFIMAINQAAKKVKTA